MRRALRAVMDGLALLLGLGPEERTIAVVLAAAGVVTLNWFSNATLTLLEGPARWNLQFWIALLGLPAVLIIFFLMTRRAWHRLGVQTAPAVTAGARHAPSEGIIVFLSTFTTFANKLPAERRGENWRSEDLLSALTTDSPDWLRILDHVQASNMQTPLEAIRHHLEAGTLRHVWLLATRDMVDDTGKIVRGGSHALAPAFERIVREGLRWRGVQLHHCGEHPGLLVAPYDVQSLFEAVDRVYREEASKAGLRPTAVTADITGGTVTMTAGMLLASVLFSRPVQFTAAESDPTAGKPLDRPTPFAIRVDEGALRRLIFRHLAAGENAD